MIVSETVFNRIRGRLLADGFVVTNEVERPPALLLGLDRNGRSPQSGIPIVRAKLFAVPSGRKANTTSVPMK